MRLINMTCPYCGNTFQVDADNDHISCEFCGNPLFINDGVENNLNHNSINNSFNSVNNVPNNPADGMASQLGSKAGQAFGQIAGQLNNSGAKSGYWSNPNNLNQQTNSNNKIWLWIIGWIFIFPVPLTILALRSNKINKDFKIGLISGGWLVWLFFTLIVNVGILSGGNSNERSNPVETLNEDVTIDDYATKELPSEEDTEEIITSNIQDIQINDTELEMIEGEESNEKSVEVTVNDRNDFSYDDIEFISEDENIATIRYVKASLTTHIYFVVTGVVPGETYVYAKSKDGEIESERIKVVVKDDGYPDPESIEIVSDVNELAIGESCHLDVETTPEDATYRNINWVSSDNSILKVDEEGVVTAVGGGTATITGTVLNEIQATYDITVDDTKKLFTVKVNRSRDDSNNIGDEWSFSNYVNGESAVSSISLSVGDTVKVSSKYSEEDNKPDIGEGSASHTVTEEDLKNGFEISYEVNVRENGGKNSGQSAHFNVSYTFSVQ